MNDQKAPERIQNAPSDYQGDGSSRAVINDRTGLYIAILAMALAAISFGVSSMTPALNQARLDGLQSQIEALREQVRIAEREARVSTERVNALTVQLAQRGIPADDH